MKDRIAMPDLAGLSLDDRVEAIRKYMDLLVAANEPFHPTPEQQAFLDKVRARLQFKDLPADRSKESDS